MADRLTPDQLLAWAAIMRAGCELILAGDLDAGAAVIEASRFVAPKSRISLAVEAINKAIRGEMFTVS